MKQAFEPEQVMGLFGRGKPSSDGDTLIDTRTGEQLDSWIPEITKDSHTM